MTSPTGNGTQARQARKASASLGLFWILLPLVYAASEEVLRRLAIAGMEGELHLVTAAETYPPAFGNFLLPDFILDY